MRDFSRLRARYLLALAVLPGCQRAEPNGTTHAPAGASERDAEPAASTSTTATVAEDAPTASAVTTASVAPARHGLKPGERMPLPPLEPLLCKTKGSPCPVRCGLEAVPAPDFFPAPYAGCEPSGRGESFLLHETIEARKKTPYACCYRVSGPGGRPFRDGNAIRVAPRARRVDWSQKIAPRLDGLSVAARRSLADHWAGEAASEHASVASFARFALQLLAVGAPSDLVEAAHEAALDEIVHARVSYAIASAYAGEPIGPAPLAMAASTVQASLATMAVETFLDGCIAETRAAIVAHDQALIERDPVVRDVLEAIADDEERHAELAWKTVAWALRAGGGEVRDAIATAAGAAFASSRPDEIVRQVVRPCIEAALACAGC